MAETYSVIDVKKKRRNCSIQKESSTCMGSGTLQQDKIDSKEDQDAYYTRILNANTNSTSIYAVAGIRRCKQQKDVSETEYKSSPSILIPVKETVQNTLYIVAEEGEHKALPAAKKLEDRTSPCRRISAKETVHKISSSKFIIAKETVHKALLSKPISVKEAELKTLPSKPIVEHVTLPRTAKGKTSSTKLIAVKENRFVAALVIALTVFAIVFFTCLTVTFVEIYNLKFVGVSNEHYSPNDMPSSPFASQLLLLNTSIHAFEQSILDDLLGQLASIPANSCSALLPSTPSGYYWVMAANRSAVRVYCDITLKCGNIKGGWIRVAHLDTTDSSQQCPSGLIERSHPSRTCVSSSSTSGCSPSTAYKTLGISYTRVCGKITGYQIGHTNAFASQLSNINSYYVDGVSLTHGSPRQHIWTFAAARDSLNNGQSIDSKCLCICNGTSQPPQFVQNDYFCDTGAHTRSIGDGVFFDQPLWDSKGCERSNNCCLFNSPPWFFKELPQPTTDDIEMRICRNEEQAHEDVAIEKVDIYVM